MALSWLDQLAQIGQPAAQPIDQGQLNQAIAAQNTLPAYLQSPEAPMPAADAPQPSPIQAMVQAPKPKALDKMSEKFKSYMPKPDVAMSPELSNYKSLADNALKDQQTQLSGLNQYINEMASKPRGLNLTPLAALVDNLYGSKLTPTFQALAPQSEEDRDKMLFGLRQQLATGQAKLSGDQLKALQDRQSYEQNNRRQTEMERHNLAAEAGLSDRIGMLGQRALIQKDNQTSHAVDLALNDKQLNLYAPRIQGADRILGQLASARAGHFLDTPQFLADVNAELSSLLTGQASAALGKQERTEYTSLQSKIAGIVQNASSEPQGINSPKILAQIEAQVRELQSTYKKNYGLRADKLRRTYSNNPEATRQQAEALDNLKDQFAGPAVPADGPDPEALAWARKNPHDIRAVNYLKLHGG